MEINKLKSDTIYLSHKVQDARSKIKSLRRKTSIPNLVETTA